MSNQSWRALACGLLALVLVGSAASQPAKQPYQRGFSFSGFQANQPSKPPPGQRLDIEFDAIGKAVAGLTDLSKFTQRGTVTSPATLPTTGVSVGQVYLVSTSGAGYSAGDGFVYLGAAGDTGPGSAWHNIGQIRGPAGANGIDGSITAGDASNVTALTKANTLRSLKGKYADLPLTPQDVGATCNGTADDTTALNSLVGFLSEIVISSGTCRIAVDLTAPKGKTIRIAAGAGITTDAGKTFTSYARIEAPTRQIFFGTGIVKGMRYNRPEWWGANPTFNSGFDSAPAINKAIASAMASFDGNNIADGERPTADISGGLPSICSPIEIYAKDFIPFTLKGAGVLNGGSRIDACPTFSGGAMVNIHGSNTGSAGYDIQLKDFQLLDLNQRSTACVRFVPEGAGYQLNTGAQRPSLIDNVHANGCPIGFDIVNTVQLRMNAPTYIGLRNNNNIGIRFASAGGGFTSAAGNIIVTDASIYPCPGVNASNCTNTTNVQIRADGTGVANGAVASVAAIKFLGQTIFWGANAGVDGLAKNGGVINDIWIEGAQFDGVGCEYVKFRSTGTDSTLGPTIPSAINQIYVHDSYHTTTAAGCITHTWQADAGGYMRGIQDHHNTMIGMGGLGIFVFNVKDFTIGDNVLHGGQNGVPAIKVDGNAIIGSVTNNKCDTDNAVGSRWNACVRIENPTNYISFGGNISFNSGPNVSNASSGANNVPGQTAN